MKTFDTFDDWVKFLEQDVTVPDVNPVRFINVESMNMWRRLKSSLILKSQKILRLSEYCMDDDVAPNLSRLKIDIRKLEQSTMIIPLSELLRLKPLKSAASTLLEILRCEFERGGNYKNKIYIPLYRMNDILKNMLFEPREKNALSYISEGADDDYSLTIIQKNIGELVRGNVIDGFKKYFVYWEENPDKPIVLHSQIAINFSETPFYDRVAVVSNHYDLLRNFHNMDGAIKKDLGTDEQWERLSCYYDGKNGKKDISHNLCSQLGVVSYSDELFDNWISYDEFKKWLLWLLSRLQTKNSYLKTANLKSASVAEFETAVVENIEQYLDSTEYINVYNERKKYYPL